MIRAASSGPDYQGTRIEGWGRTGALGIRETWIWSPEVGLLGIVLNPVAFFLFWSRLK